MGRELSNDDRRQRMAGLIELMQDECRVRDLSYPDEMATLVLVWLGACTLVDDPKKDHGPIAKRLIRGGLPIDLSRVEKSRPQNRIKHAGIHKAIKQRPSRVAPPSEPRCDSNAYRLGLTAFHAGKDRSQCPYKHRQGGYQRDWLAGFDEAGERVKKAEEMKGGGA